LSPADRKVNKKKTKKPPTEFLPIAEKAYTQLCNVGATVHRSTLSKAYFNTMSKLEKLLTPDSKSPLKDVEDIAPEALAEWDLDEVVETFVYYLKYTNEKKPIKDIGRFIVVDGNPKSKPYSPLYNWFYRMENGDFTLSEKAQKLHKSLKKRIEKSNSKRNIDSFHKIPAYKLNAVATFLDEVEQKYELLSPPISVQPGYEMIVVFSDYIMNEKILKKGDDWKLAQYISTPITQDDFIHDMLKRNVLRKKKKNGIDFNARVS
jgi:hypothetical protein